MSKPNLIKNNIEKIVVNVGVGKLRQQGQFEEKILPEIISELSLITGQKPITRPAKKAIAGFKTRLGDVVGLKVTLRGRRMFDFFTRFVNVVLPRIKDFRGLEPKIIDASGNLSVGVGDQLVFPEIDADATKVDFGLEITIVPKIKIREKAVGLYKELGVPLRVPALTKAAAGKKN
ncbi:MAG: 50S ribosomal protein L5 [Candidatus Paceibacterota bacterium]